MSNNLLLKQKAIEIGHSYLENCPVGSKNKISIWSTDHMEIWVPDRGGCSQCSRFGQHYETLWYPRGYHDENGDWVQSEQDAPVGEADVIVESRRVAPGVVVQRVLRG